MNILSERVVAEFSGIHPFATMWLWVTLIVFVVALLLAFAEAIFKFSTPKVIAAPLCTIVIVCIVGSIFAQPIGDAIGDPKTKTEYIEYKVTLEDSVSYNVFTEQYEVLDTEGEILTVRKRDDK